MESRLAKLYDLICKNMYKGSVRELSTHFSVSLRTIYTDLEKLNVFLTEANQASITITNGQVSYPSPVQGNLVDLIKDKRELVVLDTSIRQRVIMRDLLINSDGFNVGQLVNQYGLSKNTILGALKVVKHELRDHDIEVDSIPFVGYQVRGNEVEIRHLLATLMDVEQLLPTTAESEQLVIAVQNWITMVFRVLDRRVAETSFHQLTTVFWSTIMRIRSGKVTTTNVSVFASIDELQAVKKSWIKFQATLNPTAIAIPTSEFRILANKIAEASLAEFNDQISDNWIEWSILTSDFIAAVADAYHQPNFTKDEKLFRGILTHLKPAYRRTIARELLENPLFDDVINRYPKLYQVVKRVGTIIEQRLDIELPDHEVSFLTLFFAGSLERQRVSLVPKKRVIIVCREGISTSQLLNSRLKNVFDFDVLKVTSVRGAVDFLNNHPVDLVITTTDFYPVNTPVVQVSPLLTTEDIQKIQQETKLSIRQVSIEAILNRVRQYTQLTHSQAQNLYADLQQLLGDTTAVTTKKTAGYQPMLKEVLTRDVIEAKYQARDRNDAVRESGQLLVNAGAAKPSYVDAMIENVVVNGTYIVIAPGIAMPHARPETGAKRIGFSLVTLAEPVKFGHPTNDPVKLVIGLCAINHQTHLKALAELVGMLADEALVQKIIQAEDAEAIYQLISGGMEND